MSEAKDADVDRLTREEVAGAVARGYCSTANMHKELDADLVTGITNEVMALLQSLSQEAVREEALEEAAKVCDALRMEVREQEEYGLPQGQIAMRVASTAVALAAIKVRALKREPNAAAQDSVSVRTEVCCSATENVLSAPADNTLKPAPAAPDVLEVETEFRLAKSGQKYEFEINGGWPIFRTCSNPQECQRANRCLEIPPCGKFEATTGASDE